MGDVLLCGWYSRGDMDDSFPWTVGAFDLETGETLYRFAVEEKIWGLEKVSHGPYDYRVLLTDRILYRSSTDETAEEVVTLQQNIEPLFYICSLEQPDDRSHPLPDFWSQRYEQAIGPYDLTEGYVYFCDRVENGPWMAAVKYR